MEILVDKNVRVLHIEYDNTANNPREIVMQYLDSEFGLMNYSVKRGGPHPSKKGKGLMIIEVDLKG